jgi:hypothetical protein
MYGIYFYKLPNGMGKKWVTLGRDFWDRRIRDEEISFCPLAVGVLSKRVRVLGVVDLEIEHFFN